MFFLFTVAKLGIVELVLQTAQLKGNKQLEKTSGKKKTRIMGIAKLDDANNAGGKKAAQCTLILTEGDSAKALAVSGLGVVGRDDYGVFPLRSVATTMNAAHTHIKHTKHTQTLLMVFPFGT
jgi:DNA topoisomerase-2